MLQAVGRDMFRMSEQLRGFEDMLVEIDSLTNGQPLPQVLRDSIMKHSSVFGEPDLQKIFPYFAARYQRLVSDLQGNLGITSLDVKNAVREMRHRLEDELGTHMFYHVRQSVYYEPFKLFGKEVYDKFPNMMEDVSEARKCIALDRPTAAVFHLMRVMEMGVQAFGTKLGVQLANEKNWQVILDQINKEIKSRDQRLPETKALAELANQLPAYHRASANLSRR